MNNMFVSFLFCVLLSHVWPILHMCTLNIGTLNLNGARDITKRASLFSLIGMKHLNVTFVQETHSTEEIAAEWRREWAGEVFLSHKSSMSGGVGILFNQNFNPINIDVEEVVAGRILKVRADFGKVKMVFINLYAPTVGSERLDFYDVLSDVIKQCHPDEFLFLGGDFNCTENPKMDRNHPEPHVASKNCILKLSEAHELSDVWRVFHKSHRQYTWVHTKDNLLSMARLDRFYCFKHHLNVFRSSFISPVGFSDHSLVQCSVFIKQIQSGSAYWHFNTSLLSDGNFKDVFNFFWKNFSETKSLYSSLQQWWDIGKSQIQKLCLQYTFNVSKNMARSIRALEREVVELQAFADSTGERGHIENLKTKRSVLADLLGTSARGAVVRSRFQNVALMDAPSHFFFGLERKNGQRRQMMSLRSHTGQLLQESADIRRFAASFYGDLFRSEYTDNPEVSQFFYADLPKVSEERQRRAGE